MKILSFFQTQRAKYGLPLVLVLGLGVCLPEPSAQSTIKTLKEQAIKKAETAKKAADSAKKHATGEIRDPQKGLEKIRAAKDSLKLAREKADSVQVLADNATKNKKSAQEAAQKAKNAVKEAEKRIKDVLKEIPGEEKATAYEDALKKMGKGDSEEELLKTELRDSAYAAAKKNPNDPNAVRRLVDKALQKIRDRLLADTSEKGKTLRKWFEDRFPKSKQDGNPRFPDEVNSTVALSGFPNTQLICTATGTGQTTGEIARMLLPNPTNQTVTTAHIWQFTIALNGSWLPGKVPVGTTTLAAVRQGALAPGTFEQLYETLGGEFFIGQTAGAASPQSVILRGDRPICPGITVGLRHKKRFEANLGTQYVTITQTGQFPVVVFGSDASQNKILAGTITRKTNQMFVQVNARFFLGNKAVQPFIKGGLSGWLLLRSDTEAVIHGVTMLLDTGSTQKTRCAAVGGAGLRIGLGKHVFVEMACALAKWADNRYRPGFELGLGAGF